MIEMTLFRELDKSDHDEARLCILLFHCLVRLRPTHSHRHNHIVLWMHLLAWRSAQAIIRCLLTAVITLLRPVKKHGAAAKPNIQCGSPFVLSQSVFAMRLRICAVTAAIQRVRNVN